MTSIAMPIWLILTMVAAPSICLLGLFLWNIKMRRQKKGVDSDQTMGPIAINPMLNSAFQNDLHALQIDAVFNALSALIEVERIKLKNLLCPGSAQISELPFEHRHVEEETSECLSTIHTEGISNKIAARVAAGESAGEIASVFGISRSEVDLAVSIAGNPVADHAERLEAFA